MAIEEISITNKSETENGWIFTVSVGEAISSTEHAVALGKDYWEKMTDGSITPEDFIQKSFIFLLEREPKESILESFNLKDIQKYFSEYESELFRT